MPLPGAGLLLYLFASASAVSTSLVREEKSDSRFAQRVVYYVSEALARAKTRYTKLEKIAYALLMASRKLRHYFLAYDITVPASYPLGDMFRNREATGRIGKWAAELAPFVVRFVARTTIKSQLLADFNTEWTPAPTKPATTLPKTSGQSTSTKNTTPWELELVRSSSPPQASKSNSLLAWISRRPTT